MKKVALIFGTRPEAIKLAPVIHALKKRGKVRVEVCVTGQHKEMLSQVLEVFKIVPDRDLAVMTPGQTLSSLTMRLLQTVDEYLIDAKPDLVLVQGDTTTVLSASLACFYTKILVGHVEAGLRTGNLYAPWPEELNRVLTSKIATLHFAPTEVAYQRLLAEGVPYMHVYQTGNTVIDALMYVVGHLNFYAAEIEQALPEPIRIPRGRLVLITGHRRENFDGGLMRVCQAVRLLAERYPDDIFVYPVHLNPIVQNAAQGVLSSLRNVFLLPPLSYVPFVWLMKKSYFIITDSGGIQEEGPALGKPVLVTREVTERPEGIASGNAHLVGTDTDLLVSESVRLFEDERYYAGMAQARNPYGNGSAARTIAHICELFVTAKHL